jgi:hypothetical protein
MAHMVSPSEAVNMDIGTITFPSAVDDRERFCIGRDAGQKPAHTLISRAFSSRCGQLLDLLKKKATSGPVTHRQLDPAQLLTSE